jgi:hypothetical protein
MKTRLLFLSLMAAFLVCSGFAASAEDKLPDKTLVFAPADMHVVTPVVPAAFTNMVFEQLEVRNVHTLVPRLVEELPELIILHPEPERIQVDNIYTNTYTSVAVTDKLKRHLPDKL